MAFVPSASTPHPDIVGLSDADHELLAKMLRVTHDNEASGSSTTPVIYNVSSDNDEFMLSSF